MARFDVYENPGGHAVTTPYLLDVQSDLLDGLDSRLVIPLRLATAFPKVTLPARLLPMFLVQGQQVLLETPKVAAVPRRLLHTPVASLAQEQVTITAALVFLFQGY